MLSGRRLDLLEPSPLDIEIEDIAHGLARVARWNGQTKGAHGFSVAQHCVLVERLVAELERVPLPGGTLLNVNVPGGAPRGVEVARLGKRVYSDELALVDEGSEGRRLYRIYGDASYERDETGTDLAAVAQNKVAVTPLHFDLTDMEGLGALERYDLARLIAPAASEIEGVSPER